MDRVLFESSPRNVVLFLLALAVFTVVAVRVGDWLLRRKLERWADSQRVTLIEFRGAPFWSGPRAWWRTEDQHDVRVVVDTRDGVRREGWVLLTKPWHGVGAERIEVRWD